MEPRGRRVWRPDAVSRQQEVIMTNKEILSADAPAIPSTITITHYQEVGANVLKLIETVRSAIPVVEVPLDVKQPLGSGKSGLIATAVSVFESSPELQGLGFNVDEARDTMQYVDAFQPVLDQLRALARHLEVQIRFRKGRSIDAALQLYSVAKGVSRRALGVDLPAHVGNLKRQMTASNRKKKASKSSTSATPASKVTETTPATPISQQPK
jgi:hypothetical protein